MKGDGIVCPKCECPDLEVVRVVKGVGFRRRQRRCRNCGYSRIFTNEQTGPMPKAMPREK
jgi:transposase-like protein